VLKTIDFGETDRILTLLTRHFGKVSVVAKGIRKPTSRLAGHAEPLTHATYQLARGRNLDVLTGAESRALYRADRFALERSPSAPLFDIVESALRHLAAGYPPALVCRWFDLQLLDRTGFRPELGRCVQCARPAAETTNAWIVDAGGLVCATCAPGDTDGPRALSVRALKSLRYLLVSNFEGASLLRVDEPLATELERHLRSFLQNVLDRDIHAARLLDELARMPRPAPATT